MKYLFVILLSFSLTYAKEPKDYGWNIPNTPVYVGGYVDAVYDESNEENFLFDDIALLVSASTERFDFLSEVEISHLALDGKSDNNTNLRVNMERLQVTYHLNNKQRLTLGRFNSDIGYWNQTLVNILQDSTTYPHMIKHLFPKATTGLMYQNSLNSEDSYSIMLQNNKDIGLEDDSIVVDRHMAINYEKAYDDFSWRVAGGFYRELDGSEAGYAGLAFEYELDDFSIQSELFTQQSKGLSKPYSVYIQPVWYYDDKQSVVLRLERYKDEVLNANEGIVLLGYAYRPWSNMALKGEYVYHTKEPLNRFVYSVSVMF
ncbi:MAG: Unknown protein [uncultured Sulfurovum sp.]|uniref:Phosphate-selective porin O and P n=1 Tax=uncultured Sulfurovum sp. TaxID=269237 RepID=A0A6S6U6D5_9BACT|nr:MAG: Unknown protein [uncultured Sulfurovum sp.]